MYQSSVTPLLTLSAPLISSDHQTPNRCCINMATEEDTIKSMQLYCNIDRIWNELHELGYSKNSKEVIPVKTLNQFDCYDYSGGHELFNHLPALSEESYVLDIGSGIGGPARCLSHNTGCSVVGVELQDDIAMLGNDLSRVCGMNEKVHIIPGDFTDPSVHLSPGPTDNNSYDASFSILVILHIPMESRVSVFKRCFDLLKPGGKLYIEDFFHQSSKGKFTDSEIELLEKEVSVPGGVLPTKEEYIQQVTECGFSDVDFRDVTSEWTEFTTGRLGVWREQKARHIRVHNEPTYESLDRFYEAVVSLFQGGTLGGVKLTMTKK